MNNEILGYRTLGRVDLAAEVLWSKLSSQCETWRTVGACLQDLILFEAPELREPLSLDEARAALVVAEMKGLVEVRNGWVRARTSENP